MQKKNEKITKLVLEPFSESPNTFWISEEGQAPSFWYGCTVPTTNSTRRVRRLQMTFNLSYTLNGRSDKFSESFELERRFGDHRRTITLPDVRGGTIDVDYYCIVEHRNGDLQEIRAKNGGRIFALQPLKQNVRAGSGDKDLDVVIYHLSKFQQFDTNGLPLFEDGFGMYRIKQPTSEQIWNWKKHVDAAKIDFAARMETVRQIPANLRSTSPDYASLPDFTSAQVLLETFQTYGVGAFYKPFRKSTQSRWQWVANTENDGFGAKCEKTKKDVANGNPPADWN